jgi:sensor histidine kinase regulating citrate/malate metabolism
MGKTLQPGDNITDAPFPPAFQKILLDAEEYSNETIYLDNIFITFSKIAIKLEDEIVSWVVTFRDTNIRNIDQAQERQIKKRAAHYSFSDIVGENPRNTQMYRNSAAVCEIF